jgi:integrase/recombinase XerD
MTQDFIRERQYLKAVSPKTIIWYGCSFKAFEGALESKDAVRQRIVELRQRNVSPITINSYLRCINAYFRWLHEEHGRDLVTIPRLKEEQKILATFSPSAIKKMVSYKAAPNERRLHTLVCLLFDTGLRISEALSLTKGNVDLDNFAIRVHGKGGKHRLVPFSQELRKVLWRWQQKRASGPEGTGLLFATRNGTQVTVRNFLRQFKAFGEKLGISGVRLSPHTCRHTFACEYLRRGGNLEFLRRILGHSSILTTQKYLRSLGVADLQEAHEGLSPLTTDRGRKDGLPMR